MCYGVQGMVNRKGSAATMMSALANADINIKAIAQVGRGGRENTIITTARWGYHREDMHPHLLSRLFKAVLLYCRVPRSTTSRS